MKPWHWLRDTLREWRWAHTGMGLLLGTLALFNMGALLFQPVQFNLPRAWLYNVCEFGLPGVLALRIADRAVADGVPRLVAYGSAVIGVIVGGVWLIGPLMSPFIGGESDWGPRQDVVLASSLLLPLGLGTVAYAHWRRASDTLRRLQAAEVARAREEQLVQSARLLALQARVEPQFLFDTLARVRDGIAGSAAAAEQLLADLIALLRAMQPAVGATASTVQRELALVEAYARAADAPALQAPRLRLQADAAAASARLAPLLLLPALRALVGDAPRGQWRVQAAQAGARLHITLESDAPDRTTRVALGALDLAPLRERATAAHGASARVQALPGERAALLFDLPLTHDRPDTPDDHRPDR